MSDKILLVEDEHQIAKFISRGLQREGYQVITASDGETGLNMVFSDLPDLIILDVMLPDIDGLNVCRQIREAKLQTPILMLTAKDAVPDRVAGLEAGADDYLVKPFSPRELVARVKAILRRGYSRTPGIVNNLKHKGLVLDLEKHKTVLNGRTVPLTLHEFRLLHALMAAPGKVFTRYELLQHLYPQGEAIVIDRVVDVHIGKLRQKIETDPSNPQYILTVRGLGYKFSEESEE